VQCSGIACGVVDYEIIAVYVILGQCVERTQWFTVSCTHVAYDVMYYILLVCSIVTHELFVIHHKILVEVSL